MHLGRFFPLIPSSNNDPTPSIWWFTAWTRTKARFVRTYLGNFWIGLSNLLAVLVLGFVYRYVFSVDNFKYYFCYLAIGVTLWSFASGSVLACSGVFQATRDKSMNSEFTPSYFLLEEFSFQLYCFVQAIIPILLVVIVLGVVTPVSLIFSILPLINFTFFIFISSVASALIGGKYKDIGQLFPVLFQLMFLTSPIMFFKESAKAAYVIAQFNPLYRLMSSVRTSLLDAHVSWSLQMFLLPLLILISYFAYFIVVRLRTKIILWY